ncbi:hypothetical protein MMC10_008063 [Thelotrema lepadinum]|nr:hypothetical protein [Thelotrema lepadinum]
MGIAQDTRSLRKPPKDIRRSRGLETLVQPTSTQSLGQAGSTGIRERTPWEIASEEQEGIDADEEDIDRPGPSMSRQNTGQGCTTGSAEAQSRMDTQPSRIRARHIVMGQNNRADFTGSSVDVLDFETRSNNHFLAGRRPKRPQWTA